MTRRRLALGLFVRPHGHHLAAWRAPGTPAGRELDPHYFRWIARRAEEARFDFVFLADSMGVRASRQPDEAFRRTGHVAHFEPITLLSALAGATERIGLIATASTTYYEPFHIARLFGSLDHLSGGRAGWNIVTSNGIGEAENFGRARHPDREARYRRAHEVLAVVKRLWDSWEDDAFVWDKASGVAFDLAKLHRADHVGEHFSVRGPLNLPRPPQGYPVLVQAGGSEEGRDFAAATAEVIFSVQTEIEPAQAFYRDIKQRAAELGRDPRQLLVMPGLCPVIGRSRAEAREKHERLQALLDPELGISMVSNLLDGVDLSACPRNEPLPPVATTNASRMRLDALMRMSEQEGLTLADLARRVAGTRGHHQVFGTPSDIADRIEKWLEADAADGFNVMPAQLPDDLEAFRTLVMPELQRRGLLPSTYSGSTLREHLGLRRPRHPARTVA